MMLARRASAKRCRDDRDARMTGHERATQNHVFTVEALMRKDVVAAPECRGAS